MAHGIKHGKVSTRIGPVFKNKACQKAFDQNGFVRWPLLNEKQVQLLVDGYAGVAQKHRDIPIPFVSTSHSNDADLIRQVNDLILSVTEKEIEKHLEDYTILFSNFLLKKAAENSASDPHQDVTLVDEKRFLSFSIWIALTDTTPQNGCLRMLSGSHKLPNGIRPNPSYPWRYRAVIPRLQKKMIDCPMKKGEAMLFAHSTIHGSTANQTTGERLAAVIALYPREAETFHYHLSDYNQPLVQQYAMDREAFIAYVKGAPPALGQLVGQQHYDNRAISSWQLEWELKKAQFFGW